jgi:hypothetical protein
MNQPWTPKTWTVTAAAGRSWSGAQLERQLPVLTNLGLTAPSTATYLWQ